jgi:hypothetical protein
MAIVLDEIFDQEYEPLDKEIKEYAEWLGMNVEEDRELLWIARDGLKAPLPPEWRPCESSDGDIFYFNFSTRESVWDHPMDDHYRKLYHVTKAKLNEPVRVLSICGGFTAEHMLAVRCVGSLNGEEVAVFEVKPATKVNRFRAAVAKTLETSRRRVRFILPDGRLLCEDDDHSLLADVLGLETAPSVKEETAKKEELLQHKRALKVKESLARCQKLGGLAVGANGPAMDEEPQHWRDVSDGGEEASDGSSRGSPDTTLRTTLPDMTRNSTEDSSAAIKPRTSHAEKDSAQLDVPETKTQLMPQIRQKGGARSRSCAPIVQKTSFLNKGEICRQRPQSL